MCMLWTFEDKVGEMSKKSIKAALHTPYHFYFSRKFVSQKDLNRLVDWY